MANHQSLLYIHFIQVFRGLYMQASFRGDENDSITWLHIGEGLRWWLFSITAPGILLEVVHALWRGLVSCGCTKIPAQWHLPVQVMTIVHGVLRQCQHVWVNCEHCSVMLLYRRVASDLNDNQQHPSTMRVDYFQLSTNNSSLQHIDSSVVWHS